ANAFKQEGDTMTPLSSPGSNARALAINDAGQVVGHTYQGSNSSAAQAALWSGGTLTQLSTLGGVSTARAINNQGTIVGSAKANNEPDERYHAVAWRDGVIQDLGTLGGTSSWANAISDNDLIAGYASRA